MLVTPPIGIPTHRTSEYLHRDSKGELDFVERHKKLADDFAEAAALFEKKARTFW
jgi:hypothetical protein